MKKNASLKKKVIAVVGPTASGKSGAAVEIAKRLETEIISADSRQIYKEFNIAVAKPSDAEMDGVKHHLIDFVEPSDDFTVADFSDCAKPVMEKLFEDGKIPVVVGGTGLYFRILLENYDLPKVPPNEELRKELQEIAQKQGVETIYRMLEELDPELAKNMHPNNTVKIIRAIEVSKTLSIPMSQAQKTKEPEYDVLWVGLTSDDRQFLYDRTDSRVDVMIGNGLEQEAKQLFDKYQNNSSALELLKNTIGYREFYEYFNGIADLQTTADKIKQNTRHYAKRQLTWFRRNSEIRWFDVKMSDYLDNICGYIDEFVIK